MQYQTGTASSPTDLLQKIVTWLTGLGWTSDRSAAEGSGWTASLHNNGNYVHLRAAENETAIWQAGLGVAHYGLHMYLGTAYNSGQPWNNQTAGAPIGSGTNPIGVGMHLSAGPFSNYYFFADASADNIVIVLEKTSGLYLHLGWGLSLNKAGSYTGGAYFFGSSSGYYTSYSSAGAGVPGYTSSSECPFPNLDQVGGGPGFVRADVDTFTGKWIGICNQIGAFDQGYTGRFGASSVPSVSAGNPQQIPSYKRQDVAYDFFRCLTSGQDGHASLLPLLLFALRDGTTTGLSLLGTPPFIFFTRAVGTGYSNAEEYLLGGTTYKLFPNFAVVKQ